MLSYKLDFSSCAWKAGFVKSSHIYEISKFLCCDIEMTSLKHMSWMEILSTGVCIAISTLLQCD